MVASTDVLISLTRYFKSDRRSGIGLTCGEAYQVRYSLLDWKRIPLNESRLGSVKDGTGRKTAP